MEHTLDQKDKTNENSTMKVLNRFDDQRNNSNCFLGVTWHYKGYVFGKVLHNDIVVKCRTDSMGQCACSHIHGLMSTVVHIFTHKRQFIRFLTLKIVLRNFHTIKKLCRM